MANRSKHTVRSRRSRRPGAGMKGYKHTTAVHAGMQSRAKANNAMLRRTQERLASLAPKKEESRDESEE